LLTVLYYSGEATRITQHRQVTYEYHRERNKWRLVISSQLPLFFNIKKRQIKMIQNSLVRIDFSLRREVFFVVIGAIIGAIAMVVPITLLYTGLDLPYYLTWIAFGHVIGVYSSSSIIAGVAIHMITAISIGIGVEVFLYKTGILNISKLSNGLLYGLLAGSIVFIVFFIPVYQFVWPLRLLGPWTR
jgi:hypothetical protein